MHRFIRRLPASIVAVLAAVNTLFSQQQRYSDAFAPVPERVEDLLKRMTLEEKVGQMTQINISLINTTGQQKDVVLDEKKLRKILRDHNVGSFLNGEAVSPQTWFTFMDKVTRIAMEESRLKIPIIYGIDHMHGASYVANTTLFPHNFSLAGSFNPELAHQAGRITVLESADLGHHWIFAPVLDVARTPLWPRFYETYGEDPYAAGVFGSAFVRGIQENPDILPYRVAATGKHFLGYSDPRSGWDRTPVDLSWQSIHEIYRPSFQMAIDAGMKTIMVNSGEINGVPVHSSHEILTGLLRNQMKFTGVVVTDWADIDKLVDYHKTAADYKEATYQAVQAGIDLNMTPDHFRFNEALLELVKEGRISEARIDTSVRRILTLKFELGLFENPYPRKDRLARVGSEENAKKALESARESVVLLKNADGILPLTAPKKLVLAGKAIRDKRNWQGGWTYTWQGAKNEDLVHMRSFEEQVKTEFPQTTLAVFDALDSTNLAAFQREAASADAIIVAAGEDPYTEFVGNITDLDLEAKQKKWIESALATGKPVILVLVEGRPRLISAFKSRLKGIVFAGLTGTFGPQATAEILSGKTNPSAKLSFTYPAYSAHHIPYNHKAGAVYFFDQHQANFIQQGEKSTHLYPFGFGLSYSNFVYSDLKLSADKLSRNGEIIASITLTNKGKRAGKEAVLWFLTDEVASITRPVKALKHFEKISLEAGEKKTLTFRIIPDKHLSFPNEKGIPQLENGRFTIEAGGLKAVFLLQ